MGKFNFDKEKAISTVLYIAEKLPQADLHTISKILYFADQKHLVKYGSPIVGDYYVAMDNGPVPSQIYDMLKTVRGDSLFKTNEYKKYFRVEQNYIVIPLIKPDLDEFSESDIECIDEAILENKDLDFKALKKKSHGNPYLKYDCYLNCAHIKIISYKRLFDDLVANPEHSLGKMSLTDLDRVWTVAANSTIISLKNVKRFGLTGYLLQK